MTDVRSGSNGHQALPAELLHRHVDRELDASGKETLGRAAALDPKVRARIEGLVEVRTLVREAVEAQTPEIDSAALWSAIEAGLDADTSAETSSPGVAGPPAEKPGVRPALKVLPGGAPKTGAAAADPAGRVRRIGAAVIGALAIAAVAWLALGDQAGEEVAVDDTPPVPEVAPPAPAPIDTEVLAVDFGTNIGTIFTLEEGGDEYAVVWIDESDPMAPPDLPSNEEAPD